MTNLELLDNELSRLHDELCLNPNDFKTQERILNMIENLHKELCKSQVTVPNFVPYTNPNPFIGTPNCGGTSTTPDTNWTITSHNISDPITQPSSVYHVG